MSPYVAMLMVTSQIWNLWILREWTVFVFFFVQIKKFINYTLHIKGYFIAKNSFVAEVTFKEIFFFFFWNCPSFKPWFSYYEFFWGEERFLIWWSSQERTSDLKWLRGSDWWGKHQTLLCPRTSKFFNWQFGQNWYWGRIIHEGSNLTFSVINIPW